MEINLENFIKAIKKQPYGIRDCSMCGYTLNYYYQGNQLMLDTGCDCVNYNNTHPSSENELLFEINPEHKGNYAQAKKFIEEALGN